MQALAGKVEYEEKNEDTIIQLIKLAKDAKATSVINTIMKKLKDAKATVTVTKEMFEALKKAVFTDDGSLVDDVVNVNDVIALCAKQDNPGLTADQLRTLAVKLYRSGNGTCTLYSTVTKETINNFIELLKKGIEDPTLKYTVSTIAEDLDKITNWPKDMTKPDLSKLKGGGKTINQPEDPPVVNEETIEKLRNNINTMLDDKNPGMIKDDQLKSISELRDNFVTVLKSVSAELKPSVIESLAQIKDPRFLDINDDVQLQAFAGIGDTDDKPIFISRYAMYVSAKKKAEGIERTSANEEKYQSAQTDLMESIIKLGKYGIPSKSYEKIADNLKALLDESSLEGLKHVLRNLMLNSNNPVAINKAFKLMGAFDETFKALAHRVNSNKLDNETTNQIKSVFGNNVDVNAIIVRLKTVIDIVKEQQKQ